MAALPIAGWQAALDRMDAALASATRALDRAEDRWERAAAPSAGEGEAPFVLERLDARLEEWDSKLVAAHELTTAVENDLTGAVGTVEQWRALFARWEELLKKKEHVLS